MSLEFSALSAAFIESQRRVVYLHTSAFKEQDGSPLGMNFWKE
jgi:hypothetical protein